MSFLDKKSIDEYLNKKNKDNKEISDDAFFWISIYCDYSDCCFYDGYRKSKSFFMKKNKFEIKDEIIKKNVIMKANELILMTNFNEMFDFKIKEISKSKNINDLFINMNEYFKKYDFDFLKNINIKKHYLKRKVTNISEGGILPIDFDENEFLFFMNGSFDKEIKSNEFLVYLMMFLSHEIFFGHVYHFSTLNRDDLLSLSKVNSELFAIEGELFLMRIFPQIKNEILFFHLKRVIPIAISCLSENTNKEEVFFIESLKKNPILLSYLVKKNNSSVTKSTAEAIVKYCNNETVNGFSFDGNKIKYIDIV